MKRRRRRRLWVRILLSAVCLLLVTVLGMGVSFMVGYEIFEDVSYGDLECEVMDVFIPDEAYGRETNGCVLVIHGGSWMEGDKADERLMCRYIADRGYIAATVNYRLYDRTSEDYHVETVLDELDAALATLKAFAAEKGIHLTSAATYGYSAGGHLSLLYAYKRGSEAPLPVRFCADLAGPADLCEEIWGAERATGISLILSGKPMVEGTIENEERDRLLREFSPISYISSDSPPTILAYGGKDTVVPKENGDSLVARLAKKSVRYDSVFLPNSTHSMVTDLGDRMRFSGLVVDYCEEFFGK